MEWGLAFIAIVIWDIIRIWMITLWVNKKNKKTLKKELAKLRKKITCDIETSK